MYNGISITIEALYNNYKKLILYIAMKHLHNESLAEEVLQEVLIGCFKKIEIIEKLSSKEQQAYICKMAHNISCRIFEKEQRYNLNYTSLSSFVDNTSDTCYEEIEEIIIGPHVDKYIEQLSEEDKCVLVMFYGDDLSYYDIAKELNISYDAARQRVCRVKKRLSQIIKDDQDYLFGKREVKNV